jgi:hypothetical protein
MNTNHLSGKINTSVKLGLFYENELVSVMLFSKSRFMKDYEWELIRFANKLDTSVTGAASKLLSHFIKTYKPASICTYTDRRFGKNKTVYETIGMQFIKNTTPSTWWVKGTERINSQDTRFERLPKLLGNDFNPDVGIETNMLSNNWIKIEDLGSAVYGLQLTADNSTVDAIQNNTKGQIQV